MNTWKIKNVSTEPVKVSVALGANNNPGVILGPGEMILSIDRLTAPLDAQERRKEQQEFTKLYGNGTTLSHSI